MTQFSPTVTIDTSALLAVLLHEPTRPDLLTATKNTSLVAAPSLPWEIGNALVAGVRRRRLTAVQVKAAWVSYIQVPVPFANIDVAGALDLATSLGLYAYDAYVLETARSERTPLLTLDRGLARAARKINLPLVEVPE